MNQKALAKELRSLLDRAGGTSDFLQAVVVAIESLYADSEGGECPEGFSALDQAVDAFASSGD
jgi:hypothetical protein